MKKVFKSVGGAVVAVLVPAAAMADSAANQIFAAVPTSDITSGQVTALIAIASIPLGFAGYKVVRHVLGLVR